MIKALTFNIFQIKDQTLSQLQRTIEKRAVLLLTLIMSLASIVSFFVFYYNGLGLAYNDARSHLDISRRVVEGLKPGLAQLGSVWLPLPHLLMVPTVWIDFFWHTGLSGALESMISYVVTGVIIYLILKELNVGLLGRFIGVGIFAFNLNILYLQSTAMTELLLIATSTASVYYLIRFNKTQKILDLIKSELWIMLATLTRYDGWFLFIFIAGLIFVEAIKDRNLKKIEGIMIFFSTLAGIGIVFWFVWNQLIFKDALYFAFGPYSAHAQQAQLEEAGDLATKSHLFFSIKTYIFAIFYNVGAITAIIGLIGMVVAWMDKKLRWEIKLSSTALIAPLIFNIIALYLGHSVLFIQGLSGDTWFNVRYGIAAIPSVAIFAAYLFNKVKPLRVVFIGCLLLMIFFSFVSVDAVTLDDARFGSSSKNVTEVSGWLKGNAASQKGFILISAASHDAIIFSSGLPMKRFIHEGTGLYWDNATRNPSHWARWIIMRTHDNNDSTYRLVSQSPDFSKYQLIEQYPFADIYELKDEYLSGLITDPILANQK